MHDQQNIKILVASCPPKVYNEYAIPNNLISYLGVTG